MDPGTIFLLLLVLACPLMMVWMMRGGHGSHGPGGHGGCGHASGHHHGEAEEGPSSERQETSATAADR